MVKSTVKSTVKTMLKTARQRKSEASVQGTFRVGLFALSLLLVAGCSGGSKDEAGVDSSESAQSVEAPAGQTEAADSSGAADTQPVANPDSNPDSNPEAASKPVATGLDGIPIDCVATKRQLEELSAHVAFVTALSQPRDGRTVADWRDMWIGVEPETMSDTVSKLRNALSNLDPDANQSFNFFEDAAAIVDRGLAGDATAQTDLEAWGANDLTDTVRLQLPLGRAWDNSGCPQALQ
jgi:hypothetical protein